MSENAFCGQCGERIPNAAKFCKFCGSQQSPMEVDPQTPMEADPPTVRDDNLWVSGDAAPMGHGPPQDAPASPRSAPEAASPLRDSPPRTAPPPPPPPTASPPPPRARQAPGAPSPDQPREFARHAAERVESAAPGAGELAGQLASQLSTPAVAAAGLAALCTVGVMLAVGLLLALLPSENSFFLLNDGSVINQMLVNAATFTSAPLTADAGGVNASFQTMPMLFVLLPLGGMAFFTAIQQFRLAQLSPGTRLAVGAAGAVPLALLLLLVAISGKIDSVKADAGATFLLALLWGALGGALGAWWAMRGEKPTSIGAVLPPSLHAPLRAGAAALRPLLVALAVTAVVGTAIVTIQTLRDAGDVRGERSAVAATIENVLYAPEHGLHVFELGSFVQFRTGLASSAQLPIPVDSPAKVVDLGSSSEGEGTPSLKFRIFDFSDAMPSWLFILGLLVFLAIPALFAIYAGFAAARTVGAASPQAAAGFGALTGPVWAIAMVILNGVANKADATLLWGAGQGESVFGFMLLIGGVLGAVGGLLAVQRPPGSAPRYAAPERS